MALILVAEDDADIRQLVRDVLEHAGFEVLIAGDGPWRCDWLRRDDQTCCCSILACLVSMVSMSRDRCGGGRIAHHHAHRACRGVGHAGRPRAWCRRLRHQAVQHQGAGGPGARGAASGRLGGIRGPAASTWRTSRSTKNVWPPVVAGLASSSPPASSGCWPRWLGVRAGSSPADSCSMPSMARPSTPTSAPSTPTSRTSGASSSPIRAARATC